MHGTDVPPAAVEFRSSRDILIRHRADYDAAAREFRWPRLDDFNWALDWFDIIARDPSRKDEPALRVLELSAVAQSDVTVTFAELSTRSSQVANWLRSNGVRRGHHILVMLDTRVALWEVMLAAMKLGAVAVPTTTMLRSTELTDRVRRGGIHHVVVREADTAKFAGVPGEYTRIVSVRADGANDGAPDGWLDLSDAYGSPAAFEPDGPTRPGDPMLLYFTSGTTAQPKLVEHTFGSLPVGQLATMYWIGLRPGDRHLNISSPGWAKHVCSSLLAPWTAEACVVALAQPRFTARAALDALVRTQASTFCAPPTVWRSLIQEPLAQWPATLREAAAAGEPLNPEVISVVRRAWGVTVRDGYGQTEIPGICANSPGQPVRPGSMGRPLPGYRVVLLGSSGEVCDEGEVCIDLADQPLGLMSGYRDDPIRTATALAGGLYHTGDIARRDTDGHLTFVGRTDELFKSSDYRISPFELESILLEHDLVAEAAVVPATDPLRMTVPKAYVRLAGGAAASQETAGSLFSFLSGRLAPYQRIRRIEFVELPKTPSGKVRRGDLRRREQEAVNRPPGEFREEDFLPLRSVDWVNDAVRIIDQTALPHATRVLTLSTVDDVVAAIRSLAVRGAPALGVIGAFGVALAAHRRPARPDALREAVAALEGARPTAVNLARGVRRAAARLPEGPAGVLAEALTIRDEEIAASTALGRFGADLVTALCGSPVRLLTHCNTGGLATVAGGTALAVVAELHRRQALANVVVSETRPLLQGARLTAWELSRLGIPFSVAVDSAGPSLMARGEIDAVILGADRICANGDVVNKIGTLGHALGARHASIPFLVVAPESTMDPHTPDGRTVHIEDRGAEEVLELGGRRIAPQGATAVNPAFDVTPRDLVTSIITDQRVIRLDRGERP